MNIALKPGINDLQWVDEKKIFQFINRVKGNVQQVNMVVDTMKQKLKSINSKLDVNVKEILCRHHDKKKAISPEEYLSEHNANACDRHQQIK